MESNRTDRVDDMGTWGRAGFVVAVLFAFAAGFGWVEVAVYRLVEVVACR